MRATRSFYLTSILIFGFPLASWSDVALPNIFGDHMVLQRDAVNRVWGRADAGESVTVRFDGQSHSTQADSEGHWSVHLEPVSVGKPRTLTAEGENTLTINDVLVGEVWICAGQSNMEWPIRLTENADLVTATADYPEIRMIGYPNRGSQTPVWTHEASAWQVCSPATVSQFSAVGFYFGTQLHQALGVPIGLINNAWGGSAVDAWIPQDVLAAREDYQASWDRWEQKVADVARLEEKTDRTEEEEKILKYAQAQLRGNQRPGNIFQGVLASHLEYGIRGAIWYQGESNASRAYQYRELFPLMIQTWRDRAGQGPFPFYWVQLADYRQEKDTPGESDWAELREAQTMTLERVPHAGEAVIIDVGEGKDIHPRNKQMVGLRLARWALAKQYGFAIAHHSPIYRSMEKQGNKIILSFEHVDGGWRPFDVRDPLGFAIAGEDRQFVWANAKILDGQRIEVFHDDVADPVAVRYGWADNPRCNLFDQVGLPLTPFRTDDWPGMTVDAR